MMTAKQWNEDGSYASQNVVLVDTMRDSAQRQVRFIVNEEGLTLLEAVTKAKRLVCAVDLVWREIEAGNV
jgi:hypothetical protein